MKKTTKKLFITTMIASTTLLSAAGIYEFTSNDSRVDRNRQTELATQLATKSNKKQLESNNNTSVPPEIMYEDATITVGQDVNVLEGVTAKDNSNKDITNDLSYEGNVDNETVGTYTVILKVADQWGNSTSESKTITVAPNEDTSSAAIVPVKQEVNTSTAIEETPKELPEESSNNIATPSEEATVSQEKQEQSAPSYSVNTLYIAGQAISYQNGGQTYGQSIIDANPNSAVSTWGGSGTQSGSDGLNTHFIGHNPGIFSVLFNVSNGNQIVVTDSNGTPTTYTVSSIFQVNHYAQGVNDNVDYWDTIAGTGGGERITLQTCLNDTINYIVIATA